MGGHDHFYYASKGVTSWENYDLNNDVPGAEEDKGTVLVAKSGTDFRDLSEIILDLEDTPEGSVRRKIIKAMRGQQCHLFSWFIVSTIHHPYRQAPYDKAWQSLVPEA